MHWDLGGYRPRDIRVVAAWDVDERKVGRDVADAIFARPNCTQVFCDHVKPAGEKVRMGRILDWIASTHPSSSPMTKLTRRWNASSPTDEPYPPLKRFLH
jgi:myo-inositol-1-phosphate synthase